MEPNLSALSARRDDLERQLQDPAVAASGEKMKALAREYAELGETLRVAKELERAEAALTETKAMLATETDAELRQFADDEVRQLQTKTAELRAALLRMQQPDDPFGAKNAIMEIRAGAGGDEAALFAAELFRLYTRLAERRGWTLQLIGANRNDIGGLKEVIAEIRGRGAYGTLRMESGVHRVQRVPKTEKSGRVHTSTVTVAVLPEARDVDVELKPEDLKIEATTSSGHGGQSVNTTYSAIRITHLPTGTVVSCQDERSQKQNKERALTVLRSRLFAAAEERRRAESSAARKEQIGGGDRSEKIRTYNFPQDRMTDHRLKKNYSNLTALLDGDLDDVLTDLRAYYDERGRTA